MKQTDIDDVIRGGYAGKRVVVTGGCSFIGSAIVDKLVAIGAIVTVYDDLSSGRLTNIQHHLDAGTITFVKADLRDYANCLAATKGQYAVLLLAAIHGGRGYIDTHPAEICDNFIISTHIIKAAHVNGCDHIIYTSSACAYPTDLQAADRPVLHLKESMADLFTPGAAQSDGIYGWEKLITEGVLRSYHTQYGTKGVCCRLFTAYGPRALPSHAVVAMIMRSLIGQDPYVIWGDGKQSRNFTYITDIVNGILVAGLRITDCSAINVGTDELTVIEDCAKYINAYVGHTPTYQFDTTKPVGVACRTADVSMQRDKLGFVPSTTFTEGVTATIEWIKANYHYEEMQDIVAGKLLDR